MKKSKPGEITSLPPTNHAKVRPKDQLVCHTCRSDVDWETALRIPAVDLEKAGTRYLVCGQKCTGGLPVVQIGRGR